MVQQFIPNGCLSSVRGPSMVLNIVVSSILSSAGQLINDGSKPSFMFSTRFIIISISFLFNWARLIYDIYISDMMLILLIARLVATFGQGLDHLWLTIFWKDIFVVKNKFHDLIWLRCYILPSLFGLLVMFWDYNIDSIDIVTVCEFSIQFGIFIFWLAWAILSDGNVSKKRYLVGRNAYSSVGILCFIGIGFKEKDKIYGNIAAGLFFIALAVIMHRLNIHESKHATIIAATQDFDEEKSLTNTKRINVVNDKVEDSKAINHDVTHQQQQQEQQQIFSNTPTTDFTNRVLYSGSFLIPAGVSNKYEHANYLDTTTNHQQIEFIRLKFRNYFRAMKD